MLCRAKASSVSQVGLDAATDSVLFFLTGGVSFCSGVDRARGSFGEPKVTPPFLVYTLSDVTSGAIVVVTDVEGHVMRRWHRKNLILGALLVLATAAVTLGVSGLFGWLGW